MTSRALSLLALSGVLIMAGNKTKAAGEEKPCRIYIGTYTGGKSEGIYTAMFDPSSGTISQPELAARTVNPSFLAMHPSRKWLYSVGEVSDFQSKRQRGVSAFVVDSATGRLELLNQQGSGGSGPCHLSLDSKGRVVLVANYNSGSIAALPVDRDGKLQEASTVVQHRGGSVDPQRQSGPHAHQIAVPPGDKFAIVCDLGLDQVLCYRLNPARALLEPNEPPFASVAPGAGPRHLALHPKGKWLFVVNEMAQTVTGFDYSARRGELKVLETTSTLPPGEAAKGSSCAEIEVHPSGKFLYASNRGQNTIAVFAIEPGTGKLKMLQTQSTLGKTPRHFAIAPNRKWLLVENQDSDNIVVFALDPASGQLKPTGHQVEVGKPVCLVF
jgi:6-phosphogluconolactonase